MAFRKFQASIEVKNGSVVNSFVTGSESLYPSTLVNFLSKIVLKFIDQNCQNGQLHITSSQDNLLIVTSGDLKRCRQNLVAEITRNFNLQVEHA